MVELESLIRPPGHNLMRIPNDRRTRERVPLKMPCTELVGDRMHRALAANLSPSGLYVDRCFGAGLDKLQLGREQRRVQLEFELPSTHESIWALGEICHDDLGVMRGRQAMVHGTGVRFMAMAQRHERLISDFVYEHRRKSLETLLGRILDRRFTDRRRKNRRV